MLCMCVSVCASELKRIRDRKFRALDISFRNYFRKNLNMCPKAKNTLPLQYFSLTVSRSLALSLFLFLYSVTFFDNCIFAARYVNLGELH